MNSRGNAFIYILIAIALFGSLTFALSGTEETAGVSDLTEGQTTIAANEILSYAAAAQNAITSLDRVGTGADEIDFVLPSDDTDFNAAPHLNKLFHPEGGGLSYKPLPQAAIFPNFAYYPPQPGYYIGRFNNFEWTPSAEQDVIFTAFGINRGVCEELNFKITGVRTVPMVSVLTRLVDSIHFGGSNDDFLASDCAYCDEKSALCIEDGDNFFAFYNILAAR